VAGVTNGLPDLVNGDFMGTNNIYVEVDQSVDLRTWARQVWGKGEKWVVVSSNLPAGTPAPGP
jgi:hypothetical protein